MPQLGLRHEPQRVLPEAGGELTAAIVRLGRDLQRRASDAHAASRRKVLGGEVQLQEEVVPEHGERLSVRHHLGDVHLHHRELCLGVRLLLPAPRVSRYAGLGPHLHALGRLTSLVRTSPHQERQPAGVARSRRQRAQPFLELTERQMARRVAPWPEVGIVGRHRAIRYRGRCLQGQTRRFHVCRARVRRDAHR